MVCLEFRGASKSWPMKSSQASLARAYALWHTAADHNSSVTGSQPALAHTPLVHSWAVLFFLFLWVFPQAWTREFFLISSLGIYLSSQYNCLSLCFLSPVSPTFCQQTYQILDSMTQMFKTSQSLPLIYDVQIEYVV